jgi:hypothetical protein
MLDSPRATHHLEQRIISLLFSHPFNYSIQQTNDKQNPFATSLKMAPSTRSIPSKASMDMKDAVELVEVAPEGCPYLERYPLIKDKSPEELKAIEKALVRKLDWKFLPMVTAMLMMK